MKVTAEYWEKLKRAVQRRGDILQEQQRIWDKSNSQTREVLKLEQARELYDLAVRRFNEADAIWARHQAYEVEVERIRQLRAPPDLQALVLAYGTYNRITPEAWARFDRNMAEWKAKMRNGEFPTPPMSSFP